VSDDAERWVYRPGAAAPLLVPWLIAPFESTFREGPRHMGTAIVGLFYLSGFWPYAVSYLVCAVIGLGLLWRRPAAAYRRAAAWIPALFALLLTLLQLGLEWRRGGIAASEVGPMFVIVWSIAAAVGYGYAGLIILIGYAVREHIVLAPRPPAA
jgi:hypothetical protein